MSHEKASGLAAVIAAATAGIAAGAETISVVDHKAAITAIEAAVGAETAGAITKGANDERARIGLILGDKLAADRPALAKQLALETDLSADQAVKILGNTPAESAGGVLGTSLADVPQPDVGAEAGKGDQSAASDLAGAVTAEITSMTKKR